jgi:hypothetical protein
MGWAISAEGVASIARQAPMTTMNRPHRVYGCPEVPTVTLDPPHETPTGPMRLWHMETRFACHTLALHLT